MAPHERQRRSRRSWPSSASWPIAGGTRTASSSRCTRSTRCAWTGSTRSRRLRGKARARRGLRRRHPGRIDGAARRAACSASTCRQAVEGGAAARARSRASQNLDYREVAAEALAAERPAHFDVVTCMEMLEHVPDPASVVRACAALVRPGGWVFFSTINRNAKAFAVRHRRRRARAAAAAQGHARVRASSSARASWRAGAATPASRCSSSRAWNTTRSPAATGCRATPA